MLMLIYKFYSQLLVSDSNNNVDFETRANGDIVAMFSVIQNSGVITLDPTVTDGTAGAFTAPIIRVTFDADDDTPAFSNVTLASGNTPQQIAMSIQTIIDTHAGYTATVSDRTVTFNRDAVRC